MKNGWVSTEKQPQQRQLSHFGKSRPQSSNVTSNRKRQMITMKQSIDVSSNNMVWNYDNNANNRMGATAIGSLNMSSQGRFIGSEPFNRFTQQYPELSQGNQFLTQNGSSTCLSNQQKLIKAHRQGSALPPSSNADRRAKAVQQNAKYQFNLTQNSANRPNYDRFMLKQPNTSQQSRFRLQTSQNPNKSADVQSAKNSLKKNSTQGQDLTFDSKDMMSPVAVKLQEQVSSGPQDVKKTNTC